MRERAVGSDDFGSPEALITHAIDVSDHIGTKRKSMEAHASQISDESFFMKMPPEAFSAAFGTEWFIERGASRAAEEPFADDLFAGIGPGA